MLGGPFAPRVKSAGSGLPCHNDCSVTFSQPPDGSTDDTDTSRVTALPPFFHVHQCNVAAGGPAAAAATRAPLGASGDKLSAMSTSKQKLVRTRTSKRKEKGNLVPWLPSRVPLSLPIGSSPPFSAAAQGPPRFGPRDLFFLQYLAGGKR